MNACRFKFLTIFYGRVGPGNQDPFRIQRNIIESRN